MQRPRLETRIVRRHVFPRDDDDAQVDILDRQQGDIPALVDHDLDNVWRQGRLGHFGLAAANCAQDDVDVLSRRDDAPADHAVDRLYVVEVGREIDRGACRSSRESRAARRRAKGRLAHETISSARVCGGAAGRRQRMRREQNCDHGHRKNDHARPMPGHPAQAPVPNRFARDRRAAVLSPEVEVAHGRLRDCARSSLDVGLRFRSGPGPLLPNHKAVDRKRRPARD